MRNGGLEEAQAGIEISGRNINNLRYTDDTTLTEEKWKWSCSVVSDSSRPHGLQPTRVLHPWDFPGKSTGVGCHRLLHTPVKAKLLSCVRLFVTLWTIAYQSPQSMEFSSKNTGVVCNFLLQRIFPTQASNLCLLHCQADSLLMSHVGSPQILYYVCSKSQTFTCINIIPLKNPKLI